MKIKIEYVVLGALIVGLVLFMALRSGDRVQYRMPQIAAVEGEAINRITIEGGEGTVELEKRENAWRIQPQGWPADTAQVSQMVNAIADFSLTALVSEAGNYARYELDEGGRLRIRAFGGEGVLREFDLGKPDDARRSRKHPTACGT
jgi:hypothetical protein